MELIFQNHKIYDEEIDLIVHHNVITGILNDTNSSIFNLLSLKRIGRGPIIINSEKMSKDYIFMNKRRISQVVDDIKFPSFFKTVKDLMEDYLKKNNINVKNPKKKIKDSLRITGLDEELINHDLITLSNSEKKLILISMGLLSNPDTIIIEEPFKYLDLKQEKRLVMLFSKLKEQYDKTIIIKTEDVEKIYKYTEEILVIKNNQIIMDGMTKDILQRVDFLKRNGINVPESVLFTYTAKKEKDVRIDYHRDIRDIIKDIYKHV